MATLSRKHFSRQMVRLADEPGRHLRQIVVSPREVREVRGSGSGIRGIFARRALGAATWPDARPRSPVQRAGAVSCSARSLAGSAGGGPPMTSVHGSCGAARSRCALRLPGTFGVTPAPRGLHGWRIPRDPPRDGPAAGLPLACRGLRTSRRELSS